MKKTFALIMFIVILMGTVNAQIIEREVITSSGDSYNSGGLLIDFTIGETVVNSYTSSGFIITQGFQQPINDTIVYIIENEGKFMEISCFPNPTKDWINVLILNPIEEKIQMKVYNLLGSMIFQKTILSQKNNTIEYKFDISYLPPGNYLIYFISEERPTTSMKLIKTM